MLELHGDVLVGHRRGLRAVPGASIGIDVRIGGVGEGEMGLASLIGGGCPVHSRTRQRMTEHDTGAQVEQAVRSQRLRRRLGDLEPLRRARDEREIARRICRGEEQQAPAIRRDARESLGEVFLDPSGQRERCGQPEPTGELRRRHAARQLQERERIPARLHDDAVEHLLINASRQDRLQQDRAHHAVPRDRR